MMILFRLFAGGFSVLPVRLFRPVGLLLCAGFFLSAGAYADDKQSKKEIPERVKPKTSVLISAGSFPMGAGGIDWEEDERPVHDVTLDAFRIDIYEVTVADYKKCVDATKDCKTPKTSTHTNWGKPKREKHPVNGVDWNDATAYCQFAGKRLPTEAEWEKAATWKDGKKYKYPSGKYTMSCEDEVMNNGKAGCGKWSTWKVGAYPKEINGTYDMAGNVWEWVSDRYGAYPADKQTNPKGPDSGDRRVLRGGGWLNNAFFLRGTNRYHYAPENRSHILGFRCAVSAE